MKSRGSRSSKEYPRPTFLLTTAMTILLVMAAVLFVSSGASYAQEATSLDAPEEASAGEKPAEIGRLILEDPGEGTRYAEYTLAVGDSFSITFIHSVNQSPVIDCFEVRQDGIFGTKTIYYDFGAGVPTELEEGQTLTYAEDGAMILSGAERKMDNLIYRVGTVSDHILTLPDGTQVPLRNLCGRSARVRFRFEGEE